MHTKLLCLTVFVVLTVSFFCNSVTNTRVAESIGTKYHKQTYRHNHRSLSICDAKNVMFLFYFTRQVSDSTGQLQSWPVT